MARLPTSGASVASPAGDLESLKRALSVLHVSQMFDEAAAQKVYWRFGEIIGRWLSEQSLLETSVIAKSLLKIAKNLSEASVLLGGLETGIHSAAEIDIASRAVQYLALDPSVGSHVPAQELLASFCREAARIAHVVMVAHADLPEGSKNGHRPELLWYDDFTALLLDVASVEPSLNKDRISRLRGGWLFEAAKTLEPFLWAQMRSPSPEACGKRLERSLKRLRNRKRQ